MRASRAGRIPLGELSVAVTSVVTVSCLVALEACSGGAADGGGGPTGPPPAPSAIRLAFGSSPGTAEPRETLPAVRVEVQDASGRVVPGAANTVTLSLGASPPGATLSGATSVDAVDGVATFEDLSVDRAGASLTLVATAEGLDGATSGSFDVVFRFHAVTVGGDHTCAVGSGGRAYCWGANGRAQLGAAAADSIVPEPRAVVPELRFAALRAGGRHTCGLTDDGAAYCWGANDQGQLGDGSTSDRTTATAVAGGLTFDRLAAGYAHTCALTSSGAARCWGSNATRQLGDGSSFPRRQQPVQVSGSIAFATLSGGGTALSGHTCGVTADGDAYCWGSDNAGQLGGPAQSSCGGAPCRGTPGLVQGGLDFASLGAGGQHTCGVTDGGDAYCWGSNGLGQLGDGSTSDAGEPTPVTVDVTIRKLTPGGDHTCALNDGAAAWCWGSNLEGQLGNAGAPSFSLDPVAVGTSETFDVVDAGERHSCGLTPDGALWCWGANDRGQLGDGTTDAATGAVRVVEPR